MINIDYTTLALVLSVIYVIIAMVFFALLKTNKWEKGIEIWLISSVISIIGFAALFFKDIVVPYGQLVGTFALLTSTYLIIEGVLRFRSIGSKEKRKRLNLILFIVFFIVGVVTSRNSALRYLIMDAMILSMCPVIVISILKGTKGTERKLSYLFAGAFVFEGTWFAVRWFLALSEALGGESVIDLPFMGTIYFVSIIWLLLYIFSVMLIINYRSQARLQFAAEKDALTGLYNRRKLDENFNSIVDKDKPYKDNFVVYLLDVNGFKTVNDTYGHVFGDLLLVELAKKIKTITRTGDFACRFGGDEFIIILKVAGGEPEAIKARDRLKKTIEEPFEYGDYLVYIKIAVGFIIVDNPETTLDEILKIADKNMYCEKDSNCKKTEVIKKEDSESS